jgi:hypothetical protein
MTKVTARIEKDKEGTGYWIIIEHENKPIENTQMAITKEEIEPIMSACKKFIKESK